MSEVHVWDMGLLCRFFYAPGGEQYGADRFVRAVQTAMDVRDPDHVFIAADVHGVPTWRHKLYPAYKAHRPDRPPEVDEALKAQHGRVLALLPDSVIVLSVPGYEADDLVATVALESTEAGFDCAVFSGDKDMAQLLTNPDVCLFNGNVDVEVSREGITRKFGVEPKQIVDYLAIAGDTCDGVPGVRGIGPKGAAAILEVHKNLQAAIEAAWLLCESGGAGSLDRKLKAGTDQALLCHKLVSLDASVPVPIRWPWLPKVQT